MNSPRFYQQIRKATAILAASLVLFLPFQALAALSNSTAWQVQTGGSDTANSGGFRWGAFIAAPSTPSVSNITTGGSVAANTYYFVYTYTDGLGETVISAQASTTTTGSTSTITATSPGASTGALTWSCYVGTVSGGPYFPQGTGLTIGSNRSITTTPPTSGTQPRGVDYSQQNAAQISVTDGVANGTTTVTSATAAFTGSHVGNVVKIGTSFYDIVSVTNGTTIVVDRTITTGSGLTLIVGGAFASPGQAMAQAVTSAANITYVKAGTYTIGTGTQNTAGNKFQCTGMNMVGYTSNRNAGNTDTPPVFDAGGASFTMMSLNGNPAGVFENLKFTNSGANASVTALAGGGAGAICRRLQFSSIATPVATSGGGNQFFDGYMSASGKFAPTGGGNACVRWSAVNGTGSTNDFVATNGTYLKECISYNCAPSSSAFLITGGTAENCVAYGATGANGSGFQLNPTTVDVATLINCISYGNSKMGVLLNATGHNSIILQNCAAGNNTGDGTHGTDYDNRLATYQQVNCLTLTGDPFISAGTDFSLNTNSGAGAACRQAGLPGAYLTLSTTGYRSIGAVEPKYTTYPRYFAR